MWIFIFAVLAVLLFVIVKKIKSIDKIEDQKKKDSYLPEKATIKHMKVGGVLSISGFTDEYQDLDFVVEKINKYVLCWICLTCRQQLTHSMYVILKNESF